MLQYDDITKDFLKPLDSNHNQPQVSATASNCESAEEDHTYEDVHSAQQSKTATTVGDVLSVTQLVLRRGLTLLVMVVILVAGIVINPFLTSLLK